MRPTLSDLLRRLRVVHSTTAAALALLTAFASASPASAQTCNSTLSCVVVHSTPGCNSATCCSNVCALDPSCCTGPWDSDCVNFANQLCVGYCGATASGPCTAPHNNPGCDSASCCTAVCAGDPFCCSTRWDATCAASASFLCGGTPGTCGSPNLGSCFETHATGACNDVVCCNAICALDPSCCQGPWDIFCVSAAQEICVGGCTPFVERDAQAETEICPFNENDPCYAQSGGTPQIVLANRQIAGAIGKSPDAGTPTDVDVYRCTLVDSNGDGGVKVSMRFASSPVAWAAIVPDTACAAPSSQLIKVASQLCVESESPTVCLPAGSYRIIVAGGTFPTIGGSELTCTAANKYTLILETVDVCGNGCGTATGSCFTPRSSGGCGNQSCCNAVCAQDPFCCSGEWDATCVARAGQTCLTGPPANDLCASALPLVAGNNAFNTLRAGTEAPQQSKACQATNFIRDVWFRWTADKTGSVELETCGSWFDTVLAVYSGTCTAPVLVTCNDDGELCVGINASRVTFDAVCDTQYLIRVGQATSTGGETLLIATLPNGTCAECPADFDGDGQVAASDLSLLLSAWGTPARDIDGDGTTGASDLSLVLATWGACP
ncbi:MAG: hypothetical protein LW806_01840 [Planctomycetaceae bacterium]|nr:hypothetical protein [Planctomycetaceae bacterium]